MLEFERDPIMQPQDSLDSDLATIRKRTMEKLRRMVTYLRSESVSDFRLRMSVLTLFDPSTWTRLGVHLGLFFSALQGQATPSQFMYWVNKGALTLQGVIGCFAMTELGHGSNVQGLETIAVFDEQSDEFVIHTPTLTATKWWIGGAASTCTHAAVFANLVVKGEKKGIKTFIVQLRDTETFETLPGIVIGDLGSKMGRHGIDNGWIQFTNVRVPRSHMLMKHTKVKRDGTVIEPVLEQLAFGALINGRVTMVMDSANIAKKAVVIGVRYACIRRQFSLDGKEETRIMDYKIHQVRLVPLLATSYAMHFTGLVVSKMHEQLLTALDGLTPKTEKSKVDAVLRDLKVLHATSAGLKSLCTWTTLKTIDTCRQSLGGHGYSSYAGLAGLYNDFSVMCTWEGDNTILMLQTGRFLIGVYKEWKKGKVCGLGYLDNFKEQKCTSNEIRLNEIRQGFDYVCARMVQTAGSEFLELVKGGKTEEEAYEVCARTRFEAAQVHVRAYLFHRFLDGVQQAPEALKPILEKLCMVYGLQTITELPYFLEFGFLNATQMRSVHKKLAEFCQDVRKDVVPLTDAFNFTDFVISSPMGRYDGNIYENYFNRIKSVYGSNKKPDYFEELVLYINEGQTSLEEKSRSHRRVGVG